MSLQAPVVYIVPEDTERVARASFPKGNPYLCLVEELGPLYANAQFAALFPKTGQPALDPARLALITIFQFMEGLSDTQAADAVRARIDWKYALALPLTDPGFDSSVLCEFRARLVAGGQEMLLLETLLERVRERGLLKVRGRARTDSTHVLAAVRTVRRLVNVGETLRAALNAVAEQAPEWLVEQVPPAWFDRYSRRLDDYRLPKGKDERAALASTIGADGQALLTAIYGATAPPAVRELPAVQVLRAVWVQQFYAPDATGAVRWREAQDRPPNAQLIVSPYDPEARLSTKRDMDWVGYKVHLTETCDDDVPHLMTHVETTPATSQDRQALGPIHQALAQRDLLPAEHLVDAGYVDAPRLVESAQDYQVRLIGPAPADGSWQTAADQGFASTCFAIDWEAEQVTCPSGQRSISWRPSVSSSGQEVILVQFARATCRGCAVREQCTKDQNNGRRLTLHPQEQHLALAAQREFQASAEFNARYQARAGVEGTLSQGIRGGDLRQTRYRGEAKTRLQQILIAVAVNLLRLVAWFQEEPRARTRISAFADLANWPALKRAASAAKPAETGFASGIIVLSCYRGTTFHA
jgi:transposase